MDSHVYWELQPLGETTCGLHALNCIFQVILRNLFYTYIYLNLPGYFTFQGPEFRLAELQSLSKECGKLERDFLSQAGNCLYKNNNKYAVCICEIRCKRGRM